MTAPEPVLAGQPTEWQRLDPRMLLVYPVKELIRFLPVLLGLFIAGTARGGDWWQGLGIAVPVGLGLLRYFTTYFRVAAGRVELRRGLLNRHLLSTPLDRVRTVDITASPIHRLLGLATVRVGTGTASTDDDERLDLDGLPLERARRLRAELLSAGPSDHPPGEGVGTADAVLTWDPAWVRFAPLTSIGLVAAAGVLGVAAQGLNTFGGSVSLDTDQLADGAGGWPVWVVAPLGLLGLAVAVSALSIGAYLLANWGFTLSRTHSDRGSAWHLRRGLLTTRETTLDDERVRGVSVDEPLGLRLAGGARASAIVTGLDRRQSGSAMLVPPAPWPVVVRAAGGVLGTDAPLTAPLTGHGPRARTRRFTRALVPALVVVAGVAVLVAAADAPGWLLLVAAAGLPVAAALAADRARALGHTLVAGHVVARSGSLDRRREALEVGGIIGWNLRSSWFQRRAGLTTLVATTAGGPQAVTVLDVPLDAAVALAHDAMPELIGPFLSDPRA